MQKKKPIVVKMNKKRLDPVKKQNRKIHLLQNNEQAAAVEKSANKNIHTFARVGNDEKTSFGSSGKHNRIGMFKPIIFAIISAIIIGSILGIIMLNMFVNIDNELTGSNIGNTSSIPNSTDTNNGSAIQSNKENENLVAGKLEPMIAFVLQGGVFSEKANAEQSVEAFSEAGFSSYIWERDNQYYVLTGLATNKEQANSLVTHFEDQGMEVYVKDWTVAEINGEFTSSELEWLQSFQSQWQKSLEQTDGTSNDWDVLLEKLPNQSDRIASFVESIQPIVQKMQDGSDQVKQSHLLTIWGKYEEFIS